MSVEIRKVGNGVFIRYNGERYGLDKVPSKVGVNYNLISHAHIDHLPYKPSGKVLASEYTIKLASIRGYRYDNIVEEVKDVEAYDTGHILGSTAFLIGGKILYTGDINNLDRAFLKGFRPPQAEILIIESTYGSPSYVFGDFNQQVSRLLRFVSVNMVRGTNIVLRTHPLGKPQLITHLLRRVNNLYVTERIFKYNKVYTEAFRNYRSKVKIWRGVPDEEPFILIASTREDIERQYGEFDAIETRISGFMINSRSGVAMSDHSDFQGLLNIVDKVDPIKIFTIFGYSKRFAEELKKYGYDAEALGDGYED